MFQMIRGRASLVALLLSGAMFGCGEKTAETADSVSVNPPASATPLRVTDIQVGKRVGPDRRIVEATNTFGTRDTIYVSVIMDGAATDARVTARWMYNDARGINEADEMLSSEGGPSVVDFNISQNAAWQTGPYSVEIKLDGTSVGKREFRVQ